MAAPLPSLSRQICGSLWQLPSAQFPVWPCLDDHRDKVFLWALQLFLVLLGSAAFPSPFGLATRACVSMQLWVSYWRLWDLLIAVLFLVWAILRITTTYKGWKLFSSCVAHFWDEDNEWKLGYVARARGGGGILECRSLVNYFLIPWDYCTQCVKKDKRI